MVCKMEQSSHLPPGVIARLTYHSEVKALCLCKKMSWAGGGGGCCSYSGASFREVEWLALGPEMQFPLLVAEIPSIKDFSTSALVTFRGA